MLFDDAADVVVVGAGPAGAAAAIVLAQRGVSSVLIRGENSAMQPGETVHPGAETLFKALGIDDRIDRACTIRHLGHRVYWEGRLRFQAFGSDRKGPWRGFQIARPKLNSILHDRATSLGVRIIDAWARTPLWDGARLSGLETTAGLFRTQYIVDASGRVGWLARRARLEIRRTSPPLVAWFGWAESERASRFAEPLLSADEHGWSWIAQIDRNVCAWTRLVFWGRAQVPKALDGFRGLTRTRGADVTWRSVEAAAGPGFFVAGDAAVTFDPLASHGVIRAMMTGMAAADCIDRILHRNEPEAAHLAGFSRWLKDWEIHDRQELVRLYSVARPFCRPEFDPLSDTPGEPPSAH